MRVLRPAGVRRVRHTGGRVRDANCARDLRELLGHLGIGKAHILGSSAGGPIATQFALDYPELTDTLILINTMSYSQEDQREIRRQELRRLKGAHRVGGSFCGRGAGDSGAVPADDDR